MQGGTCNATVAQIAKEIVKMVIYFDNAATTKIEPRVIREMMPFFDKIYGNPGSMHQMGLLASRALDKARKKVSEVLNCHENEIIFTGSGTESINLAIKGLAEKKEKGHIISTTIEHHSVLDTLDYLKKKGFSVTLVGVEPNGIVNPEKIKKAIRKDTFLISVMYVNNEIGTIQPIKKISKIAREHNIIFHTDACQAGNYLELDVNNLGVDMMSLNGSKIHGPKGIGCLYKKRGVLIAPQIHGGGQEFGLRSGTENVPLIVGFSKALEIAQMESQKNNKKMVKIRDFLIKNLLKIPDTILNGDPKKRIPSNINITFLNIEGEAILLMLDKFGICAASGSACTSKSLDPSHVILALGRPYEAAHGSIRFSLSKFSTMEEAKKLVKVMPGIVKKLRGISPVQLNIAEVKNV